MAEEINIIKFILEIYLFRLVWVYLSGLLGLSIIAVAFTASNHNIAFEIERFFVFDSSFFIILPKYYVGLLTISFFYYFLNKILDLVIPFFFESETKSPKNDEIKEKFDLDNMNFHKHYLRMQVLINTDPTAFITASRNFLEAIIDELITIHKLPIKNSPNSSDQMPLYNKIRELEQQGKIPKKMVGYFHIIRSKGNDAAHTEFFDKKEAEAIHSISKLIYDWFVEEHNLI
jgi:hypothetical protein